MFPDAFAFRIVFPISTVPLQTPPQVAAELLLTVLFVMVRAADDAAAGGDPAAVSLIGVAYGVPADRAIDDGQT